MPDLLNPVSRTRPRTRWLSRAVVALALCTAGEVVRADAVPSRVAALISQAQLAGEGELRWLGLKVYTAQLFSGPGGLKFDRISDQQMALELRYLTSLKSETIAESSAQEIERMGFGDAARRTRWLTEMRQVFPNVQRGDRLTGVVEPGRGTRFFLNDKPLGQIEDAEFSNAFFAIWLDARTRAPSLRESLMRRSASLSGTKP